MTLSCRRLYGGFSTTIATLWRGLSKLSSLKKERVRRIINRTMEEAKVDLFDYIEIYYNRTRRRIIATSDKSAPTTLRWLLQAKSNFLQNRVKSTGLIAYVEKFLKNKHGRDRILC